MRIKLFLTILVVLGASKEIYSMEKETETVIRPKHEKPYLSVLDYLQGKTQTSIRFVGGSLYEKGFFCNLFKILKLTTSNDGGFEIDTRKAYREIYPEKSFFSKWVKPTATFVSAFWLGAAALQACHYFKVTDYLSALPFIGRK